MSNNLKLIQETFANVLGVRPDEINLKTSKENFDEWDSMKHIELVTSIEAAFGIRFKMNEIITLVSVESILNSIEKKQIKTA